MYTAGIGNNVSNYYSIGNLNLDNFNKSANSVTDKLSAEQSGKADSAKGFCKTCQERQYQDGSDDPGVSFKSPGHIAPEAAAATVAAHENEHVVREQESARQAGREIVSQSVRLYSGVCPECGKSYIAGGETTTVSKSESKHVDADTNKGQKVDIKV